MIALCTTSFEVGSGEDLSARNGKPGKQWTFFFVFVFTRLTVDAPDGGFRKKKKWWRHVADATFMDSHTWWWWDEFRRAR